MLCYEERKILNSFGRPQGYTWFRWEKLNLNISLFVYNKSPQATFSSVLVQMRKFWQKCAIHQIKEQNHWYAANLGLWLVIQPWGNVYRGSHMMSVKVNSEVNCLRFQYKLLTKVCISAEYQWILQKERNFTELQLISHISQHKLFSTANIQ